MDSKSSPFLSAASLPLFVGLDDKEKQEILDTGKVQRVSKKDILFRHGDPARDFYILVDGAIRQFRETPDGKDITISLAMRGDVVGGTHIFEPSAHYQWHAAAMEDSVLLQYPIFWFKEKLKTHSALALNMLAALSQHAHRAAIEAEQLVTFTAAQRVACFLLRLCALYDFNPRDFELPYSKTTIASKLGMELETFSRALQKLKAQGVEVDKAHVSITDLAGLEEYICSHCSIAEDCSTCEALKEHCEIHNKLAGKK